MTLKIEGQGHDQGQADGYIWGLLFNWCAYFSFRGNRIILS